MSDLHPGNPNESHNEEDHPSSCHDHGTMDTNNNDLFLLNANNKWSKNGFGEPCQKSGGKFTREESELVRRAVEDYCAMKQISTSRLCSECDHKAELKGAWMEIAKRLPHRTVQSVYRHGLRQLHPFKRGPWTESECQALMDLVTRMGKKWSAIQSKLHRSADSCRDKYREMSAEFVKGRWKDNETEILKRLIREHLRVDPNADIKELGKMVERENVIIPWSTISKRMTKRSRLSCFKKWQKMTGLFSPSDQHKVALLEPSMAGPTLSTTSNSSGVASLGKGTVATTNAATTAAAGFDLLTSTATHTAAALGMSPSLGMGFTSNLTPAMDPSTTSSSSSSSSSPTCLVESTRNAPTAGAAAAAAAAVRMETTTQDFDIALLTEIHTTGAIRESDVDWSSLQSHSLLCDGVSNSNTTSSSLVPNCYQRWETLFQEWQEEVQPQDCVLELPISEIARLLLERKQQAKLAAETVEAVDLPLMLVKKI